jgi:teichuronic acid exporter
MGLIAVVIGNFITTVISFFINTYYPGKIFGYGAKRQLIEMKSVIMAAIIMSGSVLLINHFLQGDLIKLIAGTIVAFLSYLTAAHLMKMEELLEIKKAALEVINKKMVGNKAPK